ncbi:cell death abnormality protein 1-like [Calliphora vicina]|uniref:cell death abnormality protein 1-like n=1 Tax=Calliphora vicina TaxID=7373 RepID=UPI00325B9EC7
MKIIVNIFLLQLLCNSLTLITAQWCIIYRPVNKTRVQWNNGQRMVSKRNFFSAIKYKYEPYVYSTVQYYNDYERVSVCCDGYNKVSDTKCEPICKPSCPTNSHCIRPNICECDAKYRGYTAGPHIIQCEPICLAGCSKNAQCIAPNQCECISGYEDTDSIGCQPICKECPLNSSCTKPNECTCNAGYLDNGLGECKPVCSKQCPEFSECTKPETCSCQENYEMKDDKCLPICEEKCPANSLCIKPNECDCEAGYEKTEQVNSTSFKCLAKCDNDCPAHSECVQPNVCECQPGYSRSQDLQCQPICENACPEHSSCSEPSKCLCEAGYQLKLSSVYNLFCEPVCQSNCSTFGKCVQPNKCECLEGYEMDEMEVCQPICSGGCKNGLCFQPEVCICKPGYLMGPQEECEPVCSMTCQNASCIEPEICQCHEGYRFQENSINICEPVCEPQCINGICVAANVCICNENFVPTATEEGLNHSHCQLIQTSTTDPTKETTTATEETIENEPKTTTDLEITSLTEADISSTLHSDQLKQTTSSSLQSADICHENCQCWQEIDEYGPLVTKQCSRICVDANDKPCLDLKHCQCDVAKNQLVCHIFEESMEADDDPFYYMCALQRSKATTFKPMEEGKSNEMISLPPAKPTDFPLWGSASVGVLLVASAIGGLLYVRFKKVEEPIMEYEL